MMDIQKEITLLYEQFGPSGLTNFQIEDLNCGVPGEAGVFTLADIEDRVVLIRRKPREDYPGIETYWWLPGGAYQHGERIDEAAVREFREETGLDVRIEHLLVAGIHKDERFYFFFRGHVVGGDISPHTDPDNATADAQSFLPSEISVETLWSDIDKIVLVREGFIDCPIDDLVAKHGLQEHLYKRHPRT